MRITGRTISEYLIKQFFYQRTKNDAKEEQNERGQLHWINVVDILEIKDIMRMMILRNP